MINILDKDTADKIAAGEIIERPISIVKELVENSIDARSTTIDVEIKDGGKSYIRVSDNGIGIEADQVERAFLRHATSKINQASDLENIMTLGFRGEALASICAVSRTEMITKRHDDKLGTQITLYGSNVIGMKKTGANDGTTVIIEDLFYNTPARRKFLKTNGAEAARIIDFMSQIAVTNPSIKIRLISNGSTIFYTSGKGDLKTAILEVYKEVEYEKLVPLNYNSEDLKIYGYTSKPSLTRNSKRNIFQVVNGRVVKSKTIERGILEGYKERLFEGRFPIAFIFINVNPKTLDVNIHPNKKDIRFDNDELIVKAISLAIKETLASDESIIGLSDTFSKKLEKKPQDTAKQIDIAKILEEKRIESELKVSDIASEASTSHSNEFLEGAFNHSDKIIYSNNTDTVSDNKFIHNNKDNKDNIDNVDEDIDNSFKLEIKAPDLLPFSFEGLKFKDILFGTYILVTDDNCFYLIDQHAAHERVFYETLVSQYNDSQKKSQMLMIPYTFDVALSACEREEEWIVHLRRMGYDIENFGENTYKVTAIPEFMTMNESEAFIDNFMTRFLDEGELINQVVIDKLITKSCKSAIKAHDYIKEIEAEALIEQMKKCRNPFSCPHGRPTFIRFSLYDIEKMFKRV